MQNLGSFRPLGAILGAPSHTKLDFAIPLLKTTHRTGLRKDSDFSKNYTPMQEEFPECSEYWKYSKLSQDSKTMLMNHLICVVNIASV